MFLHLTTVTSVINMGTDNKYFSTETDGEEYGDGTIRDWAMEAKTTDYNFLFHSVKPGRKG